MPNCNLCDTGYSQGYEGFCSINCYVYDKVDQEMFDYARRYKNDEFAENGDNINNIFDIFKEFSKDLFKS